MFELRKMLMTYYMHCIIYFTITHEKFASWISMFLSTTQGQSLSSEAYVEKENVAFQSHIDVDYDIVKGGISRKRFKDEFLPWIRYNENHTFFIL